jgi:hypothetical protein
VKYSKNHSPLSARVDLTEAIADKRHVRQGQGYSALRRSGGLAIKTSSGCKERIWNIEAEMGFRSFLLREKVEMEWGLLCIAHTIAKTEV